MTDWGRFAEKYRMAVASALESHFEGGTSGLEVELNILDEHLCPVTRLGFGPESRSFADVLTDERAPAWLRGRLQREVFHWMTEFATRPYYSPEGAALEAKVVEGVLLDVLDEAGLSAGGRYFALHGNLLYPVEPDAGAIPDGWSLAKRRYLAKCVALFGARLATAGIHTNHSLPEPLLSWDFFHLPNHERAGRTLADYRSEAMIRITRLLRPYCPLFIAISAASPLRAERAGDGVRVVLTAADSNRLLTFPNPETLDVPHLYASHPDYLRISYDLVRRGVRFGGNNWTPVRARSDVDPVNRIISTTSEQLRELYRKGLYAHDVHASLEEAEEALLVDNLCALVDLPMSRVEVRTDEGGDSLDLAVAKVAFKELLALRIYADPGFGAGYGYDEADVARARANEAAAADRGLDAQLVHPFTSRSVSAREWLAATLADLAPLAETLGYSAYLEPLAEMAAGGPNPAGEMRAWFASRLVGAERTASGEPIVPEALLREWLDARTRAVARDVAHAAAAHHRLGDEAAKLDELLGPLAALSRDNPLLPVRIATAGEAPAMAADGSALAEVIALATTLVRIPSVTNCADERLDEVMRCGRFIASLLRQASAEVRFYDDARYPAVVAGFPGALLAPVTLGGHFDVVEPDPNDTQFSPRVEGDYLWGRGAADMKTVVASYLVWMRRALAAGPPYPAANLLLVGNEENGEAEAWGTPQVLADLKHHFGWSPELMILGERTGEQGSERLGQVCVANRGVVRLRLRARGERGHSAFTTTSQDLLPRLVAARDGIAALLPRFLTLDGPAWRSQAWFPFLKVGEPGIYNVTPDEGVLGLEVRPIPEDDLAGLLAAITAIATDHGLEVVTEVHEGGIACPGDNPHLVRLLAAVGQVAGGPAPVGKKLAGTSARFAPGGNAVVWGQTGIGPHARNERHFIPSIEPYLACLDAFLGTRTV
jgi:succinyl-diaminopimelate desuccinylase